MNYLRRSKSPLFALVAVSVAFSCREHVKPRLDENSVEHRLLKKHLLLQPYVHPFFWRKKGNAHEPSTGFEKGIAGFERQVRMLTDDISALTTQRKRATTTKLVGENAVQFVKSWKLLHRTFQDLCREKTRQCAALDTSIESTMLAMANFFNMRQTHATHFLEQQSGLKLPSP